MGIFYYNESYFLFDENGKIIDKAKPKDFLKLILFKGIDSNIQAKIFLDLIPLNFQGEIKEAIYVNNRRWDVKLKNEITLKLGENLDLEFTQSFRDNMARGVEVLGFRAKVTRKGIELDKRLTLDWNN